MIPEIGKVVGHGIVDPVFDPDLPPPPPPAGCGGSTTPPDGVWFTPLGGLCPDGTPYGYWWDPVTGAQCYSCDRSQVTFPTPPPPPPPPPPYNPPYCGPIADPPIVTCPAPVVQCPDPVVTSPSPETITAIVGATIAGITGGVPIIPPGIVPPPPYPPGYIPGQPPSSSCPDVNVTLTCPEPKDKEGKPDPGMEGEAKPPQEQPPFWARVEACNEAAAAVGQGGGGGILGGNVKGQGLDAINVFGRLLEGRLKMLAETPKNIVEAVSHVQIGGLGAPLVVLDQVFKMGDAALSLVSPEAVPNRGAAVKYATRLATANLAQQKTGAPLSYLYQSDMYLFQYANPQYLPSQPQIDTLYNTGYYPQELWDCHTRANGNIPVWASMYRDAQSRKAGVDDLIRLYLRNEISLDQAVNRARATGMINPAEFADQLKLAVQIPGQADLIRMMVRDAADEELVRKYGYDNEFDTKFAGQVKAWSIAMGVPADIMKYVWRSHWTIPSNTQLYEMLHRLRPDREEAAAWNEFAELNGEEEALAINGPRPSVVTIDDVRQAITANDMSPYWVDKLIATSYHPITRTDAVRAFKVGAFTRDELKSVMLDNGYTGKDAELLTKFYEQDASIQRANQAGVLTLRKIAKLYKEGALPRSEARSALEPLMNDENLREEFLNRADLEARAEAQSIQIKGIKKRFMTGGLTKKELLPLLEVLTADELQGAIIADRWETERSYRLKEVSAAMLCKWYGRSLITEDEYVKRLHNLGYPDEDARKIFQVCDLNRRDALAKAQDALLRRLKAEAAAAEKDRIKRLKENCKPQKYCLPDGTVIAQSGPPNNEGEGAGS